MYLLDTVVISELRKKDRNPGVVSWFQDKKDTDLFLSVLTIGEIRRGICQQETKNRLLADRLATWLDSILNFYGQRILPVTTPIALEWGNICARSGNNGADNLIAATAKVHHLSVITRNINHFDGVGISCYNPWI
ncbi:MAG: type II toxin-antitoxin system VapC family toxin [Desulfovibrio desulfuricans]|nr:type II toxin-antitoxin system VapC family toxin [Desulfovibrio desulfuricans]